MRLSTLPARQHLAHPGLNARAGRPRWPRPAARHPQPARGRPGLPAQDRTARAQAAARRTDLGLWTNALAMLALCLGAWLLVAAPATWPLPGTWPTAPDDAAALWSLVGLGTLGLTLPAGLAALHLVRPAARHAARHPARAAGAACLAGAAAAALWAGGLWVAASGA